MPYDSRIAEILNKIPDFSTSTNKYLLDILKLDFDTNLLMISPNSINDFGNSLIHIIAFDRDFKPIKEKKIEFRLNKPINYRKEIYLNEYGSAIVEISQNMPIWKNIDVVVTLKKNGRRESLKEYFYNYNKSYVKERDFLFTVLTDLEQYRPGQPIYVRGILWEQIKVKIQPISELLVYISLINHKKQEIIKQKRQTDEFGVFDVIFPLEVIIPEGNYTLKFEFPEFDRYIEKTIRIKRFIKPKIKIEIDPIDSKNIGENVNVQGKINYFYGDPCTKGRGILQLMNYNRDLIDEKQEDLGKAGELNATFSTNNLNPGKYIIFVKIIDNVGREAEKTIEFTVDSKEVEQYLKESKVFNWDFSLENKMSEGGPIIALNFTFTGESKIWYSHPLYIYLKDKKDMILKIHETMPSRNDKFYINIPPDLRGLYFIEIGRIGLNGSLQRKEHSILITSKIRQIDIEIKGKDNARPGEELSFDVNVISEHEHKTLELGCILVDAAARTISGGSIPRPFENIIGSGTHQKNLIYRGTWFQKLSRLRRGLDDFLGDLFETNKGAISTYDLFYLVKFIEKSQMTFKEFIDFHKETLYYLFKEANPDDIIDFIENFIIYHQNEQLDFEKITKNIFKGEKSAETLNKIAKYLPTNLSKGKLDSFNLLRARILVLLINLLLKELKQSVNFSNFTLNCFGSERTFENFCKTMDQWISIIKSIGIDTSSLEKPFKIIKQSFDLKKDSILAESKLRSLILYKKIPIVLTANSKFVNVGFSGEEQPQGVFPTLIGYPKYTSIMTDVGGKDVYEPPEEFSEQKLSIRTFFADTGYWNPRIIVEKGNTTIDLKLPDSITQQDFVIHASSKDCDIGVAKKSIHVNQEFFIQTDLPATLIYGDKITIGAVITNRTENDFPCEISFKANRLKITDPPMVKFQIGPNSMKKVQWEVQAIKAGEIELEFIASTPKFKDIVKRKVFVHPNGDPVEKITQGILNPNSNSWTINVESNEIAHYAFFSIIPDELHGALDGLEAMLKYPYGCVEQTMGCVLSNLLVFEFLKISNQLTERFKGITEEYTLKGLQRLLHFRHGDLGWGWWENDQTSIFMTSYVLQGLTKMNQLGYYVSENIINETISRIFNDQQKDGSWVPEPGLIWDRISKSGKLKPCVITIYIVQRLLQAGLERNDGRIKNAIDFITKNLNQLEKDPNGLSMVYLLLQSIDKKNSLLSKILKNLISIRKNILWSGGSALGGDIESSALAIRVLFRTNPEKYDFQINEIVGAIIKQRNVKGGWKTTSDTAAVVETFLELQKGKSPTSRITLQINDLKKKLYVDNENLDIAFINMRNIPLYQALNQGNNVLKVDLLEGNKLFYQLSELIWTEKVSSDEKSFSIKRNHSKLECQIGEVIKVNVSIEALTEIVQFVVIEELIPSGFLIDEELLRKTLESNPHLDCFEIISSKIIIFPKNASKFDFHYSMIAVRPFEGTHPSTLVSAMYEPKIRATSEVVKLQVFSEIVSNFKKLFKELPSKNEMLLEEFRKEIGVSDKTCLEVLQKIKQYFPYSIEDQIIKIEKFEPQLALENIIGLIASLERKGGI